MATIYVDLVLDTGEIVHIECPGKHKDELHDSIEHAMRRRECWSPSRFDGCRAEYGGVFLDRVNMGRVIGLL